MKEKTKTKGLNEKQVMELLKSILPKTTSDLSLAGKILDAVELEFRRKNQATTFEKFLERCELPDLENTTVQEVTNQLHAAFGPQNVSLEVNKKLEAVDIVLQVDDATLAGQIKVHPNAPDSEDPELKLKFISFPVAMPADPELVWNFGKQENLTNEEAGIALSKVEEEFWMSKKGQKLIRDRVNRSFPEFVNHVPAAMLREVGLKRHYKEPEAIRIMKSVLKD